MSKHQAKRSDNPGGARVRHVLTRAKAERQIAAAGPEALKELAARPEFAKHANKHVRAKLERKTAKVEGTP
jgi:hypothetical protein